MNRVMALDVVPHRVCWSETRRYGKKTVAVQIMEIRTYWSTSEQLSAVLLIEKSVVEDSSLMVQSWQGSFYTVTFSKEESDMGMAPELLRHSARAADKIFSEVESKEVS